MWRKGEGRRSLFGVDHPDGGAAIDGQRLAVDEVVRLVAQKEAHAGDVFGGADPSRRVECMVFGAQQLLLAHVDPSRGDGVDRDAERGQRDGQRVGQRVDAALRGGVGFGAGLTLQVARRAEVDDAAIAAIAVLLAVEGQPARGDEDRAQVGGDHAVELLDREFGEGLEEADPDIVDQDVDVAQRLEDLLHALFETVGISDVDLDEAGAGFGGRPGTEFRIDVAEYHSIALSGKGLDDSPSDSVGTARNEYASFHDFRIFPQR